MTFVTHYNTAAIMSAIFEKILEIEIKILFLCAALRYQKSQISLKCMKIVHTFLKILLFLEKKKIARQVYL